MPSIQRVDAPKVHVPMTRDQKLKNAQMIVGAVGAISLLGCIISSAIIGSKAPWDQMSKGGQALILSTASVTFLCIVTIGILAIARRGNDEKKQSARQNVSSLDSDIGKEDSDAGADPIAEKKDVAVADAEAEARKKAIDETTARAEKEADARARAKAEEAARVQAEANAAAEAAKRKDDEEAAKAKGDALQKVLQRAIRSSEDFKNELDVIVPDANLTISDENLRRLQKEIEEAMRYNRKTMSVLANAWDHCKAGAYVTGRHKDEPYRVDNFKNDLKTWDDACVHSETVMPIAQKIINYLHIKANLNKSIKKS